MERYVMWYVLSVKNYWKKRSSYLTILGMTFLIWIISGISAPNAVNMSVGLYCGESSVAEQIKDSLMEDTDFEFMIYEEEDELIQDVVSGRLDSGFVFSDEFDEMMQERDTRDGIHYYKTTFSTKGEVLKEKIFEAYFRLYSTLLLEDVEQEVFGNHESERLEKLLEKNEAYLGGDNLFQLDITQVESAEAETEQTGQNDVVKGLILLSLFLIMFLSFAETQTAEADKVGLALNQREQFIYRFLKMQAASILPAVIGFIVLMQFGENSNFFYELFRVSVFLLISGLWINVVGKRLGKAENLPTWLLSIIVLHIVLCPIVYDFSIYLPSIKWIRMFIPLGIYYFL